MNDKKLLRGPNFINSQLKMYWEHKVPWIKMSALSHPDCTLESCFCDAGFKHPCGCSQGRMLGDSAWPFTLTSWPVDWAPNQVEKIQRRSPETAMQVSLYAPCEWSPLPTSTHIQNTNWPRRCRVPPLRCRLHLTSPVKIPGTHPNTSASDYLTVLSLYHTLNDFTWLPVLLDTLTKNLMRGCNKLLVQLTYIVVFFQRRRPGLNIHLVKLQMGFSHEK